MARKKIDKLVDFAKGYGAKGLAYIAIHEDGTVKSSFSKFMTEEENAALIKAMDGENGDLLLFAADKNKVVWDVLGALRLELARQMELLDKNEYKFLWSKMFEVLGFTPEQAQEQFGFLLNAFKYGVPPHAGLAYGLDRLVMLMAKQDSIRDVIAFPKVKDASDLMTEAPERVDPKQLEELGLELEEQTEDVE